MAAPVFAGALLGSLCHIYLKVRAANVSNGSIPSSIVSYCDAAFPRPDTVTEASGAPAKDSLLHNHNWGVPWVDDWDSASKAANGERKTPIKERQIILIRHGQYYFEGGGTVPGGAADRPLVVGGDGARVQVTEDDKRLTALGQLQAEKTGEFLYHCSRQVPFVKAQTIILGEKSERLREAKRAYKEAKKQAEEGSAPSPDEAALASLKAEMEKHKDSYERALNRSYSVGTVLLNGVHTFAGGLKPEDDMDSLSDKQVVMEDMAEAANLIPIVSSDMVRAKQTADIIYDKLYNMDKQYAFLNNNRLVNLDTLNDDDDGAIYTTINHAVTNKESKAEDEKLRARVRIIDPTLEERFPCDCEPPHTKKSHPSDREAVESVFHRYFFRPQYGPASPAGAGAGAEGSASSVARRSMQNRDSETIIIVGHANVIRYFVMRALQLPPEAWLRVSLPHASITAICVNSNGVARLRCLGAASHLPPDAITIRNLKGECKF